MRIKRQFSREFKLEILAELETKTLAEVCRAHELAPSTVSSWRKDYDADPKEAFKGHGRAWKEGAKIAKYERIIGQLYAENEFLKKVFESLKQKLSEERRKERCCIK